jgi:hypothetical protein
VKNLNEDDNFDASSKRSMALLGMAALVCVGASLNPVMTVAIVMAFILFYNAYQISHWMFPDEQKNKR